MKQQNFINSTNYNDKNEQNQIFKNYLGMKIWQQRHLLVSQYITKYKIKSIIDLGCSTGSLIQRLSRSNEIQLLIGVDINKQLLINQTSNNINSQLIQYDIQYYRQKDQIIQLWYLNILQKNKQFLIKTCQLLTLIQVIQHFYIQSLQLLIQNIFGFIQPKFILITTPNHDFNRFFLNKSYRHWDHKFQWNQQQFKCFVQSTAHKFQYQYEIVGIGQHINDMSSGFCSQGAFFTRKSPIKSTNLFQCQSTKSPEIIFTVTNKCWKSNKIFLVLSACINGLYQSQQHYLSWQDGIEFVSSKKIGLNILSQGSCINKQFLISILSQQSSIICNDQGFFLKQQDSSDNDEENESYWSKIQSI